MKKRQAESLITGIPEGVTGVDYLVERGLRAIEEEHRRYEAHLLRHIEALHRAIKETDVVAAHQLVEEWENEI